MKAIERYAAECTACPLHENRTNSVFSDGSDNADIMIVGEAPGAAEDKEGRPFVGQSGKLLRGCLDEAGIENYYITNTVKCRPPDNRDPKPQEKEKCFPFLSDQIKIVNPNVILPLGLHAAKFFVDKIDKLGDAVGEVFNTTFGQVMPLYHPAFILRQRSRKSKFEERLQRAGGIGGE